MTTSPSAPDLALAAGVMTWIGVALVLDRSGPMLEQVVLGLLTWGGLVFALAREAPLVRAQTGIVVVLATIVEYTFSPSARTRWAPSGSCACWAFSPGAGRACSTSGRSSSCRGWNCSAPRSARGGGPPTTPSWA